VGRAVKGKRKDGKSREKEEEGVGRAGKETRKEWK
jgi:hypothetical protein